VVAVTETRVEVEEAAGIQAVAKNIRPLRRRSALIGLTQRRARVVGGESQVASHRLQES
jgi:hypothetical protein